jgi:diadenosine tetraphosphatase ApaH/serine/threonine PP2A family protein phosphatase
VVGYNPNPNECIKRLRDLKALVITGNHDAATAGKICLDGWIGEAIDVWYWNRVVISEDNMKWLRNLPSKINEPTFTIVHGTPDAPITEYMTSLGVARINKRYLRKRLCFVGHTHVPAAFKLHQNGQGESKWFNTVRYLWMNSEDTYFVNPGSVGQPRDGDPRASYMIYNSDTQVITLKRIEYDIEKTQERMTNLNFPQMLIDRLSVGH